MANRLGITLQDIALVSADGIRLHAWFARPLQPNGDAVILMHGVGDSRHGMIGFASAFLPQGYAVLMPDSRGHGSSGGVPSYGIREVDDVVLWYEWLRNHDHPQCVFGMGESMGAAILLQSLNRVPFCAAVAESPFASFRQVAYIRVGQFFNTGTWLGKTVLRPAIELAFLYGRLTRGVWLSDASPERSVAKSRVPVLLIHGTADTNIPLRQSERILACNQSAVDLWRVPKAGHCGASAIAGLEFYRRVGDWFVSHRSPANGAYMIEHHRAYGGPKTPPIDHQGIEDSFLEKASAIRYYYGGRWMKLTGADLTVDLMRGSQVQRGRAEHPPRDSR